MTRPESTFDFRNPDHGPILQARVERLAAIRQGPALLAALKVVDWGRVGRIDYSNEEKTH